ncbi:MAG TPA: thiol:disulfide interchange protein DsbA/DsbL [Gammaproteobacteria bacterium]|nr:thiol:disulfide interchange protein DsbA/DsbL [Gammaproteobacteria bacterium]
MTAPVRFLYLLLFISMPGMLMAEESRFVLGIEYQEIIPAQQTTAPAGKVEVVELFWYGCGHCYRMEPYLKKWLKTRPDYIHFVRMPAQFNKNWEIHARAYYAARALGVAEKSHDAFFNEIHQKHKKMLTLDELAAFYLRYGVTREKFVKAYNSFTTGSRLAHAKGMVQRYGARSVPVFIVNGKYRTNETLAGNKQDLFAVIDELAKSELNAAAAPDTANAR